MAAAETAAQAPIEGPLAPAGGHASLEGQRAALARSAWPDAGSGWQKRQLRQREAVEEAAATYMAQRMRPAAASPTRHRALPTMQAEVEGAPGAGQCWAG